MKVFLLSLAFITFLTRLSYGQENATEKLTAELKKADDEIDAIIARRRAAEDKLFEAQQNLYAYKKTRKKKSTPDFKEEKARLNSEIRTARLEVKKIQSIGYRRIAVRDSRYYDSFEEDYIEGTKIEFFGNGTIQRAVSESGEIPANTGLGVLFDRIFIQPTSILGIRRLEIAVNINIASTVDTVKADYTSKMTGINNQSDFGNAVLLPINSGRAATAYARAYFDPISRLSNPTTALTLSGIQIRLTGSSRVWTLDSVANTPGDQKVQGYTINAATLSGRVGLFHEFLPNNPALRKDFSITLGLDWSWRWLFSDIGAGKKGEEYRRVFLNNSWRNAYNGIEPYINIRLKNIRAEVSIPILFAKNNQVDGLTGSQFVTSITFIGGFPLKIDTNKKPAPSQ